MWEGLLRDRTRPAPGLSTDEGAWRVARRKGPAWEGPPKGEGPMWEGLLSSANFATGIRSRLFDGPRDFGDLSESPWRSKPKRDRTRPTPGRPGDEGARP